MKLKESKEKVPATFITAYISEAWDKVGAIKTDMETIKNEYADTKVVCACLQDIMDAYLIAAGRLQAVLDDKNYVDMSIIDDKSVEESLTEDVEEPIVEDTAIDRVTVNVDTLNVSPEFDLDLEDEFEPKTINKTTAPTKQPGLASDSQDCFEYTCNFDTPELTSTDMDTFKQITSLNR